MADVVGGIGDPWSESWEPEHFLADLDSDRERLQERVAAGAVRTVHDALLRQIAELLDCRDPASELGAPELARRAAAFLQANGGDRFGSWVLYPWSGRLVRLLPRALFREVRTNRNRYKITPEEQERLAGAQVGIVGLSVGNMAAVTLAIEGIGGTLRIADFDRLDLSNLNRLRNGVHALGLRKTVLAAREILEVDPWLTVTPFHAGLDGENLDEFLLENGKLDVVVEECDDLFMKVVLRERARELGIPVVMDTSDRGLLDVERFDREPNRPVFHGLLGDVKAAQLQGLPTRDKVPFVLAVLGGLEMSPRMAASLPEVKESVPSWPQLASDVAMGGGVAAATVRRILLGELQASGRYRVDVDAIVADGRGQHTTPAPPPADASVSPVSQEAPVVPPRPSGRAIDADTVRWLVGQASLAPSPHNAQPWRFTWSDDRLECRVDPARDFPHLDHERGAIWLTFGAVAETVELAAPSLGLVASTSTFTDPTDPDLACVIALKAAPGVASDPLAAWIPRRLTNRHRPPRAPLPRAETSALVDVAGRAGGRLQLVDDARELDEVARLLGACDRVTWLNRNTHADISHGLRWTREEVESHRDGIDIHTMELTASERAGLRLMADWRTMSTLKSFGGGAALALLARKLVAAAGAVAFVDVPGTGRDAYFHGGRVVQRVWLEATRLGLAIHPMSGLPYLLARVERGDGAGLDSAEQDTLRAVGRALGAIVDRRTDHTEVFVFRLARAGPPTARSLRRPVDAILTFPP